MNAFGLEPLRVGEARWSEQAVGKGDGGWRSREEVQTSRVKPEMSALWCAHLTVKKERDFLLFINHIKWFIHQELVFQELLPRQRLSIGVKRNSTTYKSIIRAKNVPPFSKRLQGCYNDDVMMSSYAESQPELPRHWGREAGKMALDEVPSFSPGLRTFWWCYWLRRRPSGGSLLPPPPPTPELLRHDPHVLSEELMAHAFHSENPRKAEKQTKVEAQASVLKPTGLTNEEIQWGIGGWNREKVTDWCFHRDFVKKEYDLLEAAFVWKLADSFVNTSTCSIFERLLGSTFAKTKLDRRSPSSSAAATSALWSRPPPRRVRAWADTAFSVLVADCALVLVVSRKAISHAAVALRWFA